jgi:hypothetical protein
MDGGWHGVITTGIERMAAPDPAHGQPRPAQRPVRAYRFQPVFTARGGEPAPLNQQRADEPAIQADQGNDQPGGCRWPGCRQPFPGHRHRRTPTCRRSRTAITRSSSAARSAWRAVAADGCARTTSRLPPASEDRYSRTSGRRRRRTLFRTTALPTARLTTNPARGGTSSSPAGTKRCPVSSPRLDRLPCRTASEKSRRRLIRDAAGSTSDSARGPVRR